MLVVIEEARALSCRWQGAMEGSKQREAWSPVEVTCCPEYVSYTEVSSLGTCQGVCKKHGTNDNQGSVKGIQQTSSSGYKEGRIRQRKETKALFPMSTHLPTMRLWLFVLTSRKPAGALDTSSHVSTSTVKESVKGTILEKHLGHWKSHHWAQQPLLSAHTRCELAP